MKYTFDVELTDTFAGGANYAWVRREKIDVELTDDMTPLAERGTIVGVALEAVGRSGVVTQTEPVGDGYEVRFMGMHEIMFISFNDE